MTDDGVLTTNSGVLTSVNPRYERCLISYFCTTMKDRLKFVFLVTGVAAAMIIICQLYWVYFNYQTTSSNFTVSANYALKQSIDQYQLTQIKLPTSLQNKRPTLTFMTRTLPSQDPIALDTPNAKRRFSAEFSTVAVDEAHLPELKALVARLTSQQHHHPINLDTLSLLFHQELRRNNVTEQFRLSAERGAGSIETQVAAKVNYYKDPMLIKATLTHPRMFILRHNFGPVIISTLLILLSAGSLFYMGRIIKRQTQLDGMKTDFINNISHELKTPLSILRTSNEALANFGAAEDPASLKRYLAINAQVIDELDTNINRMMELPKARPQNHQPRLQKIVLQELVAPVISAFSIGNNTDIQLVLNENPFEIYTDQQMLAAILTNLVDNSVKYSGTNTQVLIRVERHVKTWRLEVADNGLGIAAAYLPYIFDKFYRVPTENIYNIKGYGIGLSYVKDLVATLNGQIDVTSKPGVGTTFKLTFNS
jgi:two-component system phosphate regulon sensor histidine kinase PhoR